jgi:hemerythrin-like metal-binding protein
MYINWNDSFKIGVDVIDLEHQILFMLIKKLDYAIKQNAPTHLLVRILIELKEYAQFHFISEENLMLEIGFPDYAAHEQVHSNLLSQLEVVGGRINLGLADSEDVLSFVWNWLQGHVLHQDIEIAKFLAKNQHSTLAHSSYASVFPAADS